MLSGLNTSASRYWSKRLQHAQHVARNAVLPSRSRLVCERDLGEALCEFLWRKLGIPRFHVRLSSRLPSSRGIRERVPSRWCPSCDFRSISVCDTASGTPLPNGKLTFT